MGREKRGMKQTSKATVSLVITYRQAACSNKETQINGNESVCRYSEKEQQNIRNWKSKRSILNLPQNANKYFQFKKYYSIGERDRN